MDELVFTTAIEIVGVQTPPVIAAAPTSLTATADSDSIVLAWTNGDTYTGTVIQRKTTGDFVDLATAAGNATGYDDTTAVAGTTYTYHVRGLKGGFPTSYSNSASDTVPIVSIDSIQYFDNVSAGNELATVVGSLIHIDIDAGNSTANQIRTAFNANTQCTAAATCTVSGTGTNAQNDVTLHSLSSGVPTVIQDLTYTPTF